MTPQQLAQQHESAVVKHLGDVFGNARLQPGSGNQPGAPNDIVAGEWHVECKATSAKSMSVKHDWLQRARKLALGFGKRAVLAIRFGKGSTAEDYFVIRAGDFYDLLASAQQRRAVKNVCDVGSRRV